MIPTADIVSPPSGNVRTWSSATSAVELSLVGSVDLRADGRSVRIKSRKACAILAYLALSPSGREPRERLCGLLWSESAEAKARTSLRQVLHGLQADLRAARLELLSVSRQDVVLDRRWLGTDVAVVEEDLRFGSVHSRLRSGGQAPQALCLDLQGLDPAFDVWLDVQREMLQRRLVGGLERLLQGEGSATAAEAILDLDSTHEAACRALMCRHAENGDLAASLRVYNDLWDLLDRDYDSEPSPETKDLVVAIKTDRYPEDHRGERDARPARGPAAGSPSRGGEEGLTFISVSQFDGAGVPDDLRYIVSGLRHEIVASLVRFREWAITDDGGDGFGAGHPRSVRRYSLEGTIRQSGTALFVTLTVKQRPTGRYVWSEAFELLPDRWFEIRSRIVGRIAVALNVRLSARRSGSGSASEDVSPAAYDLWLRGHQLLSSWRLADRRRAAEMLLRVLDEAPGFAPAYGSLVRLYNSEHIVRPGVRRDAERAGKALQFARVGVQLDPLNSRTHLGFAWSLAMSDRHDEAEASFRDAIELNGHDTWTMISAAQGLSFCGSHVDAVNLADRVLELDANPSRPSWGYQVGIRYLAREHETALDAADRAADVISNLPGWRAATLARLGRSAVSRDEASRFLGTMRATWQVETPATDAEIATWFLSSFPIRGRRDWLYLRDGLAAAGMQV